MTTSSSASPVSTPDAIDDGAAPRRRTAALLEAMGITRVIWVDDQHFLDDQSGELDIVIDGLYRPEVLAGVWGCLDLASLDIPATSDRTSPEDTGQLLRDLWATMPGDLHRQLGQVVRTVEGDADDPDVTLSQRSSEAEAVAIADLFDPDKIVFLRLSLRQWREREAEIIAETEPTLLLLDRDFSNEDLGEREGEQTLANVMRNPAANHVSAAMFSRTVESEDAERELAVELAREHSLDATKVTAIGKFRTTATLPEALRVLLLAKELEEFRHLIVTSLDTAHEEARARIESLHRYTLMGAIAAAAHEGSYELDLPTRIAMNTHRPAMIAGLRGSDAAPLLGRFRDVAARVAYLQAGNESPEIAAVLREDIFEGAALHTAFHLPLEVGDIFETFPVGPGKSARKPKTWVLLAQACDLAVRSDGRRRNAPLNFTLTQIRPAVQGRALDLSLMAQRMIPIGALEAGSDASWSLNAGIRISVPVAALDATVFGVGGSGTLPSPEPSAPVAEGWLRRREAINAEAAKWTAAYAESVAIVTPPGPNANGKAKKKADDVYNKALRMIGNALTEATTDLGKGVLVGIDPAKNEVEFGIRRVGRISTAKANYLLNLAHGYYGRPADDGAIVTSTATP